MPVEINYKSIKSTPVATYLVAAVILIVTLIAFIDPDAVIRQWGLVPDQSTRLLGLTFISSFLLHGGIFHLLGNLYFLLIFGDNVEDTIGIKYYLLLIGLSAFAGDMIHIVMDPDSTTPLIGASGGISGILTFYCLAFPRASIGILFLFRWLRLPVGIMLAAWFSAQVLGGLNQLSGFTSTSSLAHLGGALVGVAFWVFFKFSDKSEYLWSEIKVGQTGDSDKAGL